MLHLLPPTLPPTPLFNSRNPPWLVFLEMPFCTWPPGVPWPDLPPARPLTHQSTRSHMSPLDPSALSCLLGQIRSSVLTASCLNPSSWETNAITPVLPTVLVSERQGKCTRSRWRQSSCTKGGFFYNAAGACGHYFYLSC